MTELKQLVRPCIWALSPYSSARDEFYGEAQVYLDANENPYGALNRYPDPYQRLLKKELSNLKGISEDRIFIGNGSDEIIDLLFRVFCEPGKDTAMTFTPTYGMYKVSAEINDVTLKEIPLDQNFQLDIDAIKTQIECPSLKLIFICSPNNPTGNLINSDDIQWIIDNFQGITIIDEAYVDFSPAVSNIRRIQRDQTKLVVLQTFSKAYGLAGARVGMAYSNPEIIELLNKVKPPYNVSQLNQQEALKVLKSKTQFEERNREILNEKARLKNELNQFKWIKRIYPSDANFWLIEVENATQTYDFLVAKKIIIRNRDKVLRNCLRITIGTASENNQLIKELQAYKNVLQAQITL